MVPTADSALDTTTDPRTGGARVGSATRPDPGYETRLAELMGVLNTVTAELVGVLSQVLDNDAWAGLGYRSPEHWVQVQCGVAPGRAARWLEVARRRGSMRRCDALFRAGGLSEDQAALVYRHTGRRLDAWSAQVGPWLTVGQMRRVLRWMPTDGDAPTDHGEPDADNPNEDGADTDTDDESAGDAPVPEPEPCDPDPERGTDPVWRPGRSEPERREVRFGYDDDGGWWCRFRLPADEGALVQKAFEAARNRLFRDRHPEGDNDNGAGPAAGGVDPTVTWADALVLLAQLGLDGLDPDSTAGRTPGERYQVLIHLDADRDRPPTLHLGPLVQPWSAEYLACDSSRRWLLCRAGVPVGKGRRSRSVDPTLRAVVEHRDGGCRVPVRTASRWLHVHHIRWWTRGGETEVTNLCCLCPVHHRMVHRGELTITGDPTRPEGLTFTNRHGHTIRPPGPRLPDQPGLAAAHALRLPAPTWHPPTGEPLDSWAISWS